MTINFNNNISFGQMVSTQALLRAGCGAMNFEDAKLLNNELGIKYAGHIGFYPRAQAIVQKAAQNDKKLAKIFEELKCIPRKTLDPKIRKYEQELGPQIDITV